MSPAPTAALAADSSRPGSRYAPWLLVLALAVSTLATYRGVSEFEYVNYDDNAYVYENEALRGGLTLDGVQWAFTTGHAGNWHPVTWLSHMLDAELYGVDAEGSAGAAHRTNLLLHTANGILLFLLLSIGTGRRWASFLVAALFLLHPLRVESVAWVSERKDLLCAFFYLAGLGAYGLWARRRGTGRYLLVVLCTALALLSKPMAVSLPCVLLVVDVWPLNRLSSWSELGARLREKAPFFALAGTAAFVTWSIQKEAGAVSVEEQLPLLLRLENMLATFWVYLRQSLWPTDLACFYPLAHTVSREPGALLLVPALLGGATLVGTTLLAWKKRTVFPQLFMGWSWYVITLLPVIGIVQVGRQAHADRYTYLPLIGPALILAFAADALLAKRERLRIPGALVTLLALVSLSVLAQRQSRVWRDSASLYEHALEVTQHNYLAHANLGVTLRAAGDHVGALREFEAALAVGPPDFGVRLNVAIEHMQLGRMESAGALLEALARQEPADWRVHSNLGEWAFRSGDLVRAEAAYLESFRLGSPHSADRVQLGLVHLAAGQLGRAGEQLRLGRTLDPLHPGAAFGLGLLALRNRDVSAALFQFEEAVRLAPAHPQANLELGLLLAQTGERARAKQHLMIALEHNAQNPKGMKRLAWILATAPEPELRAPEDALALASVLAERDGFRSGPLLEVLAAALARSGDSSAAVQRQNEALQVQDPALRVTDPTAARARLLAYRAGRAWVDERQRRQD